MSSIGGVVYSKLKASTTISTAVNGVIVPEWRDDLVPAIVYELRVEDVANTYQDTGPIDYDLTISCIADKYATAAELADEVIRYLDRQTWEADNYIVLGCFYSGRDEDYVEVGSKNKRLAVVDLRFEFLVNTADNTEV